VRHDVQVHGIFKNAVDQARVRKFMDKVIQIRGAS